VKSLAVTKYLMALIGAGMLVVACCLYFNVREFLGTAERTEGTVVALRRQVSSDSTTYVPVVRFQLAHRHIEFDSGIGSRPPRYTVGEKVPVLYQPANPYQAKIDSFLSLWFGPVLLAGMGSIFCLVGAGLMLATRTRSRTDDRLMHEGMPIEADFQQVDVNTSLSLNGRHPFRVLAQWQDPTTSRIHVFTSHNLWFDPSKYITQKQIRVYVDRVDPKRYYVDLSFLPQLAN
jgi:Protein of unknown function (DUF3592)